MLNVRKYILRFKLNQKKTTEIASKLSVGEFIPQHFLSRRYAVLTSISY